MFGYIRRTASRFEDVVLFVDFASAVELLRIVWIALLLTSLLVKVQSL